VKFFIYARKSTDDEERQMLSIEAQLAELREYATSEGLTVTREFIESRTAKTPRRPIFNDMLTRIESGEASGLLAWHPDRLARNRSDGAHIIHLVDSKQLSELRFPKFWFEDTPQGKFLLSIAFSQSAYYVDALAVNIRRGMRQKLRRGEFPGKPPIGYLEAGGIEPPSAMEPPQLLRACPVFAVSSSRLPAGRPPRKPVLC